MSRVAVGLVAAIAAVLLVGGCSEPEAVTRAPSGQPSQAAGFVAGDGTVTVIAPAERRAAPELVGTTLDGRSFDSRTTRGKVVVLNVWGSWCAPCRKEAPELRAASRRLAKGGDVVFVGINTRDVDRAPALAFQRRFAVTYPSLYDPAGKLLLGFAGSLPPSAIPSTLVVDRQGRVAARILGATTTTTLVDVVEEVGSP